MTSNPLSDSATQWDIPVRAFHWSLVFAVSIALATGFFLSEWWLDLHTISGYAIGILVIFRLAWGLIGSKYSRFSTFPLGMSALRRHLSSLRNGTMRAAVGHNPAGAWMIVILLSVLTVLTVTGLLALGGQENLGPMNALASYKLGQNAALMHAWAAWILAGAIAFHLMGVVVETKVFRHPVLRAMGFRVAFLGGNQVARGGVVFLVVGVSLVAGGFALAGSGSAAWRAIAVPASYASECGDCHHAHHPVLRSENAWRRIVQNLGDHFGEDATLDPEVAQEILQFLMQNHAATFDTEAAHEIGRVETKSTRITDTDYWKFRHKNIAAEIYRAKPVGSKVNCNGCHLDAQAGRFDDARILLPKGRFL